MHTILAEKEAIEKAERERLALQLEFARPDGELRSVESLQRLIDQETETIRILKAARAEQFIYPTNENAAKLLCQ